MNYFQLADKINQLHKLDFAERALLNQITSYQFNNKTFYATNEYLSKYWGVSERSITRYITKLIKLGFITVEIKKKKHTSGDGNWYNKRYITSNIEVISIETSIEPIKISEIESVLTLEPEPIQPSIIEDDEPVLGVFAEQDNEYTRMIEEALQAKSPQKIIVSSPTEYCHEAVLELIEQDYDLQKNTIRVKEKGTPIDEKYTEGTFFYRIKNNKPLMEKYRAIASKLATAE